jgi:hypothetical protein
MYPLIPTDCSVGAVQMACFACSVIVAVFGWLATMRF